MYSYEVLQKSGRTSTDSSQCQLRGAKYPSPRKLGIGVLGYLLVDIGVETALGANCRQVLLRLASSAPEKLSAKCTLCSFNWSTPRCTWSWVGEVLPLFRRTSSRVFFSFVLIWVFEYCHFFKKFFHNLIFSDVTIWVWGFVIIWVLSQFEFLSFVTIWVFEFCHNFSF